MAHFYHCRNVTGIVRKVSIHCHQSGRVQHTQADIKTGDISRAQAKLARPVQDINPVRVVCRPGISHRPGAIRRIIIDDNYPNFNWQSQQLANKLVDIIGLVIGRHDSISAQFTHIPLFVLGEDCSEVTTSGQRPPVMGICGRRYKESFDTPALSLKGNKIRPIEELCIN